jgi:hypothetical protein
MTDPSGPLPRDFRDLLSELTSAGAEFVVIGGHAVARHGYVRTTLDLDVFVRPSAANAARVFRALASFGAPLAAHGVTAADFERPGAVYQVGLPPTRIDVLTAIDGVDFDSAWATRVDADFDGVRASVLGRDALLRNKRSTGRPKDLLDADELERT